MRPPLIVRSRQSQPPAEIHHHTARRKRGIEAERTSMPKTPQSRQPRAQRERATELRGRRVRYYDQRTTALSTETACAPKRVRTSKLQRDGDDHHHAVRNSRYAPRSRPMKRTWPLKIRKLHRRLRRSSALPPATPLKNEPDREHPARDGSPCLARGRACARAPSRRALTAQGHRKRGEETDAAGTSSAPRTRVPPSIAKAPWARLMKVHQAAVTDRPMLMTNNRLP